jgi:hypothetical protein
MTEAMETSYNALKSEVAAFRSLIVERISKNEQATQYYKGCTIMFSHLKENPPFLFLGINPGGGTKDDRELNPDDGFEYLNAVISNPPYDYALARNTRNLFKKAGLYEHLEHSVKTNIYYVITSKAKDLSSLFSLLGDDVDDEFYRLAHKWTNQMIELVKPQVIICEGMEALEKISWLYETKPMLEASCGYFELKNKIAVIGYSRRFSNIRNEDFVAEFLKTKLAGRL